MDDKQHLESIKDYAKNYGFVFTGWGAGALLGTLGAGVMRDLFGTFSQ